MGQLLSTLVTVAVALALAIGAFVGLNRLVDLASPVWRDRLRPWVFVGPAMIFLGVGLVWPTIRTLYLSFRGGRRGEGGFTFGNYSDIFTDKRYFSLDNFGSIFSSRLFILAVVLLLAAGVYLAVQRVREPGGGVDVRAPVPTIAFIGGAILVLLAIFSTLEGAIWNNLWWVASVAGLSTVLGLLLAILADRSRGESLAKSMIFMPMAISMVGAAVIWRYVYYKNTKREDIGLLNEILSSLGLTDKTIDFYTSADLIPWNNFFIMIIMIWIQVGFAMVVLSAAIKAVPTDLIEAARIDGASEVQTLWRVVIPQLTPTIIVVVTTLIVSVMKVFDLVKATTNGRSRTDVLANAMYENLRDANFTLASTLAMIIFFLVLPVMIYNVRSSAKEA